MSGKEAERAAYNLARSIKSKGIKGTPIARPVMERNKSRVLALIDSAVKKITELMRVK